MARCIRVGVHLTRRLLLWLLLEVWRRLLLLERPWRVPATRRAKLPLVMVVVVVEAGSCPPSVATTRPGRLPLLRIVSWWQPMLLVLLLLSLLLGRLGRCS